MNKLFKAANLKKLFKTPNVLQNHPCNTGKPNHQRDTYQNSRIYQLTCVDFAIKSIWVTPDVHSK
jgi:hypothetical protein